MDETLTKVNYYSDGDLTLDGFRYFSTDKIVEDFPVSERQLQAWRDSELVRPATCLGPANRCYYDRVGWAMAGIIGDLLSRGATLQGLKSAQRKAMKGKQYLHTPVTIEHCALMAITAIESGLKAPILVYAIHNLIGCCEREDALEILTDTAGPTIVTDLHLLLGPL